jgi:hypothetical protein
MLLTWNWAGSLFNSGWSDSPSTRSTFPTSKATAGVIGASNNLRASEKEEVMFVKPLSRPTLVACCLLALVLYVAAPVNAQYTQPPSANSGTTMNGQQNGTAGGNQSATGSGNQNGVNKGKTPGNSTGTNPTNTQNQNPNGYSGTTPNPQGQGGRSGGNQQQPGGSSGTAPSPSSLPTAPGHAGR